MIYYGVLPGVDVKPPGMALGAQVCFRGMLAYVVGTWCLGVCLVGLACLSILVGSRWLTT
ncbi:hypothetical protein J1N35_038262, partial [Gossypium stocksii]